MIRLTLLIFSCDIEWIGRWIFTHENTRNEISPTPSTAVQLYTNIFESAGMQQRIDKCIQVNSWSISWCNIVRYEEAFRVKDALRCKRKKKLPFTLKLKLLPCLFVHWLSCDFCDLCVLLLTLYVDKENCFSYFFIEANFFYFHSTGWN